MQELKRLFTEYDKARGAANKADEAWSLDPDNQELEAAFDEAYKVEFDLFSQLADYIVSYARIDAKTARAMINGKRDQLKALVSRIA